MLQNIFSSLTFILTLVLIIFNSISLSKLFTNNIYDKFWICIAGAGLQLGLIGTVLSLFKMLNLAGFLCLLLLISILTFFIKKYFSQRNISEPAKLKLDSTLLIKKKENYLKATTLFLSMLILFFVILSGLHQAITPLTGPDEITYHGPKVLHWIENQSLFPYINNNDRQVVFSFGGELFFFWPLLFTKSELIARLFFWLAYPLSMIGCFILASQLKLSLNYSLITAFVFGASPIVLINAVGIKPELWTSVFVLGIGYWVVSIFQQKEIQVANFFFSGIFFLLAFNTKFTALALLPALIFLLVLFFIFNKIYFFKATKILISGILVGLLGSGILITLIFNLLDYGNIFGPKPMLVVHQSDFSLYQIYVHSIRLVAILVQFPIIPVKEIAISLSQFGNNLITTIGAANPLPLESKTGWPGAYSFYIPQFADRYSLIGLLWLPALLVGVISLIKTLFNSFAKVQLKSVTSLVLLSGSMLFGIVLQSRWQENAGVPERFIIAPYALGAIITCYYASFLTTKFKVMNYIANLCLVLLIIGPLPLELYPTFGEDHSNVLDAHPYYQILSYIKPGSNLLNISGQSGEEYYLFDPNNSFSNSVTSWGKTPFDSNMLTNLVMKDKIEYVIIENDREISFHWLPSVNTVRMVEWLSNNSNFLEIKTNLEYTRLFKVL